jgi:type IV pilus assembly protein PilY1
VEIETGKLLRRLDVPDPDRQGKTSMGWPTGLSSPAVVDLDSDGTADLAYAGDLSGNLYRFDLRSKRASDWNVSFDGHPLFTARNEANHPQSIVVKPQVTRGPKGMGRVVLFGAGPQRAVSGQSTENGYSSIYGIYDFDGAPIIDRGRLAGYVLWERADWNSGRATRRVEPIVSTSRSADGWYVDLGMAAGDADGIERIVAQPAVRDGQLIVRSEIASRECGPHKSWVMSLPVLGQTSITLSESGRRASESQDALSSGEGLGFYAAPAAGLDRPVILEHTDTQECARYLYVPDAVAGFTKIALECRANGRQTWRQIH